MLYYLVRPIVRFALKIFFKKIHLSNLDNIPDGKPVILAANHPTAFLEPCILACFQKRGLFYLVRGDIFTNKFYARILQSFQMIPVYRKIDRGYSFIKQNYSTFSTCHQALADNRVLMILAEGSTEHEKRLRPLMKGIGRIAFGALEAFPDIEDVYIVPVGVNYTYAERFRSEVYIDFGEPISARSFEKIYNKNANQGIHDLTESLRKNLEPRVIIIREEEDDDLVERLFQFDRSRRSFKTFPIVTNDAEPLHREKQIADFVNQLDITAKQQLARSADRYFALLSKYKLDTCARFEETGNRILQMMILIFGFPLFFMGYISCYPPMWVAQYITRTKVNHITFVSSVLMAAGVLGWIIYILLILAATFWLKVYYLLLIPFLGLFALYYMDVFDCWKCGRVFQKLSAGQKMEFEGAKEQLNGFLPI